jgi:hypothetical protein
MAIPSFLGCQGPRVRSARSQDIESYRRAGGTRCGRAESTPAPGWEHGNSFPHWNATPRESLWNSHMEILRKNEIADERSNRLGTQLALALAVAMVFQVSAQAQADECHVKAAFLFNFANLWSGPRRRSRLRLTNRNLCPRTEPFRQCHRGDDQ